MMPERYNGIDIGDGRIHADDVRETHKRFKPLNLVRELLLLYILFISADDFAMISYL